MGQILTPVFTNENPVFVFALASLLAFIAVLEIRFNKLRHTHDHVFLTAAVSIVTAVGFVSFFGNAFAFGAKPWWRPRNYIPTLMTGSILGGQPVGEAVRYQQIMVFMMTTSASLATIIGTLACVFIIIDEQDRLRTDRIHLDSNERRWSLRRTVKGWLWRGDGIRNVNGNGIGSGSGSGKAEGTREEKEPLITDRV
ncbi:hypothetical protein HKX48_001163 [Thoreauomyces humboldtii]|nr:hypothetical protein HKX48_001163 [Thoreauomyces humboldtii]